MQKERAFIFFLGLLFIGLILGQQPVFAQTLQDQCTALANTISPGFIGELGTSVNSCYNGPSEYNSGSCGAACGNLNTIWPYVPGSTQAWNKYNWAACVIYSPNCTPPNSDPSCAESGTVLIFDQFGKVYSTADKIYTDINPSAASNLLSPGSCTNSTGNYPYTPYKASCSYDYNTKTFNQGRVVVDAAQNDSIPPSEGDAASGDLTCYTGSTSACPIPTTTTITADGQSSETVNAGTTINLSANSNGINCTITNPDSQTGVGIGTPYNSSIPLNTPGIYTWTLSCDQTYPTGGPYVGCYTSPAYTNSSDRFLAPPITSQATVTVTGQQSYSLTVQAQDLFGNPLNVPVTVDSKSGNTIPPFIYTAQTAYNESLPISVPNLPTISGKIYKFFAWTFNDTVARPTSNSENISLNSQYNNRVATAVYDEESTTTNPNGGPSGGNGGNGTPTNWYYCLNNQNSCSESSATYSTEQDCQNAVNLWHSATSTTPAASDICYQSQSACNQVPNSPCNTGTPPATSTTPTACTGSGCPTATLTAFPSTINYGQSSELTWTSTNADTCTAKPDAFNISGTSGYQFDSGTSLNGSARAFPNQTTNYSLTCSNSTANATVTVRRLGCVGTGCPGKTGPGDVGITNFIVNNKNAVPSLPNQLACVPDHSPDGINKDIISWSATAGNSCAKNTPSTTYYCNGTQPSPWSLTSPINSGSCSIQASNGWSSGSVSFTDKGAGSFSPSTPQSSTDYTLSCKRNPYTCNWTQTVYELHLHSCGKDCSYTTCDSVGQAEKQIPVQASTESLSNTLVVVEPPTISNFSPNRANILIHQPVDLGWNFTPNSSDSGLQRITLNSFCYSGGGSGDTSGWNATAQNPFNNNYLDNLLPQKSTIYNLICRSAYDKNASCYAESNANTTVNVFNTNLQETGTGSGFLAPINNLFAKTGGIGLLGNILSGFKN